ncbi:nickel ABC transporter ATP-binding protein NikE [Acrocarpospora catenulata]|uniref:nickel ABC transporter ATP-binding protein NikE n=1 Tax=Acrocarpospora catenulata TaxID=2836182 RepID=UPI001BDAF024|nr:ABC transporter ATP-binding protein [Acrocarpospora catenulata]
MNSTGHVLSVRDLTVTATRDGREREVVARVSLDVAPGEIFGIVGESGSGKTMLTKAATGLLPGTARVSAGTIEILGRDVTNADARAWRSIHAHHIGVIFQNAATALNPRMTVFSQVREALPATRERGRLADARRVRELLETVEIDQAARRLRQYPHELSGGIAQRVVIAMALARDPKLLVADEATTALDAVVQRQILDLIGSLRRSRDLSVVLISHNLDVVRDRCDRTVVMRRGEVVEAGDTRGLLTTPVHPYTRELLAASPSVLLSGPRLHERPAPPTGEPPVVSVRQVTKRYAPQAKSPGGGPRTRPRAAVEAVSLAVHPGEIVGLVGASGSGKTTTARMLVGLVTPDTGTVQFDGRDVTGLSRRERAMWRRDVQFVFQDNYGALNPRYTVAESVLEPLRASGRTLPELGWTGLGEVLSAVGLDAGFAGRHPRQLSGGERQRVGIARALVSRPKLIVADEPVSALDATIQKRILDLIIELNRSHGTAFLVISHDLGVIAYLCSRVLVMNEGEVVEHGDVASVLGAPRHPYTAELIAAVAAGGVLAATSAGAADQAGAEITESRRAAS